MTDKQIQQEMESVRNDLKQLQGDVAGLVSGLKSLGLDKVNQVGENAKETAEEQLERLKATLNQVRSEGESQVDSLQKEIGQRPLSSVAAAFAVGYILGKLLDRS